MSNCISIEFQPFFNLCAFECFAMVLWSRIWNRKYRINSMALFLGGGGGNVKHLSNSMVTWKRHTRKGWIFAKVSTYVVVRATFQEDFPIHPKLKAATKLTPFFIRSKETSLRYFIEADICRLPVHYITHTVRHQMYRCISTFVSKHWNRFWLCLTRKIHA